MGKIKIKDTDIIAKKDVAGGAIYSNNDLNNALIQVVTSNLKYTKPASGVAASRILDYVIGEIEIDLQSPKPSEGYNPRIIDTVKKFGKIFKTREGEQMVQHVAEAPEIAEKLFEQLVADGIPIADKNGAPNKDFFVIFNTAFDATKGSPNLERAYEVFKNLYIDVNKNKHASISDKNRKLAAQEQTATMIAGFAANGKFNEVKTWLEPYKNIGQVNRINLYAKFAKLPEDQIFPAIQAAKLGLLGLSSNNLVFVSNRLVNLEFTRQIENAMQKASKDGIDPAQAIKNSSYNKVVSEVMVSLWPKVKDVKDPKAMEAIVRATVSSFVKVSRWGNYSISSENKKLLANQNTLDALMNCGKLAGTDLPQAISEKLDHYNIPKLDKFKLFNTVAAAVENLDNRGKKDFMDNLSNLLEDKKRPRGFFDGFWGVKHSLDIKGALEVIKVAGELTLKEQQASKTSSLQPQNTPVKTVADIAPTPAKPAPAPTPTAKAPPPPPPPGAAAKPAPISLTKAPPLIPDVEAKSNPTPATKAPPPPPPQSAKPAPTSAATVPFNFPPPPPPLVPDVEAKSDSIPAAKAPPPPPPGAEVKAADLPANKPVNNNTVLDAIKGGNLQSKLKKVEVNAKKGPAEVNPNDPESFLISAMADRNKAQKGKEYFEDMTDNRDKINYLKSRELSEDDKNDLKDTTEQNLKAIMKLIKENGGSIDSKNNLGKNLAIIIGIMKELNFPLVDDVAKPIAASVAENTAAKASPPPSAAVETKPAPKPQAKEPSSPVDVNAIQEEKAKKIDPDDLAAVLQSGASKMLNKFNNAPQELFAKIENPEEQIKFLKNNKFSEDDKSDIGFLEDESLTKIKNMIEVEQKRNDLQHTEKLNLRDNLAVINSALGIASPNV